MSLIKHGTAAGISIIAVCALSLASVVQPNGTGLVADIAIEHAKPLSLTLEAGVLGEAGYAEFVSQSDETIFISVPSTWKRHEVKNAPIDTVTSQPPSLGFTRWTLPPKAGISFHIADAPDTVILHHPSGVQMKLRLAHVNLETETVKKDVLLIQDETVVLW